MSVIINNMKIGHIYYRFPMFSGTSSYYKEFLDGILSVDDSISIILLASKYPPKANIKTNKRFQIIWIKWLNIPILNNLFFEIAVFISGLCNKSFKEIDLIHVSNTRGVIAAKLLSLIYKKPLIITLEMLNDPTLGMINKLVYILQKLIFKYIKSNTIVCWSNYYYNILSNQWHIENNKIQIIPPGINTKMFNPYISGDKIHSKYANGKLLIVFAKPLYPGNYSSALLLLQSICISKYKEKIMILYGNGEYKNKLEIEIEKRNMKNQTNFMPKLVPLEQIPEYLSASDFIVLSFAYPPTIARSFLEALAVGKPIIVTNLGEIPFVVTHGKNAMLSSTDPKDIAKNIDILIANPNLQLKLSKNAYNLINTKFSEKNTSKIIVDLYKELL